MFLVEAAPCNQPKETPTHQPFSAERMLLKELGLPKDANDNEIIKLLDEPGKMPHAIGLIRYRKITAASVRLTRIVNDTAVVLPVRISSAHALCDFGNKEWIEPMKVLVADPNSRVDISSRISIAGLLARVEDYSQYEILAKNIDHHKRYIRSEVVQSLSNFRGKVKKETIMAADLLASVATSDPEPWIRNLSIKSLEKIVKERPDLSSKLTKAAEANLNSDDDSLKSTSRGVLKRLKK
jgi:hypothetical protein